MLPPSAFSLRDAQAPVLDPPQADRPFGPASDLGWNELVDDSVLRQHCEANNQTYFPDAVSDAPHPATPLSHDTLSPRSLTSADVSESSDVCDPAYELSRCSTPEYAWYAPVNSEPAVSDPTQWPALAIAEKEAYQEFLVEAPAASVSMLMRCFLLS